MFQLWDKKNDVFDITCGKVISYVIKRAKDLYKCKCDSVQINLKI